jgi:hypothetical protein
MMYEFPALEAELTQGDIIEYCPILSWTNLQSSDSPQWELGQSKERVIVLTQACDLANAKTTKVQVAIVHNAQRLFQAHILKPAQIRDQVRMHRVFGLYFLPECNPAIAESIVDLRDIHTVPMQLLDGLRKLQKRVARIPTPFREHMAQHLAVTFSRIALPEPYNTVG